VSGIERYDGTKRRDRYLELSQAETTAGADAAVVLEGRAADNGAELVDGAGSDGGSLSSASVAASLLLAGLVEVHADAALPILAEVVVGDLLVVLDGLV
jgi:hypothetical protein